MYKIINDMFKDLTHFTVEEKKVVLLCWGNGKKETLTIDFHLEEDVAADFNPLVGGCNPYISSENHSDLSHVDDYSTVGNLGRVCYEVHDNVLFICAVFVHPRMRGKGYMKHLLAMTHGYISDANIDYVVLNPKMHPTSPMSTDTLTRAYKGMGFVSMSEWCNTTMHPKPSNKIVWKRHSNDDQKKVRKYGDGVLITPVKATVAGKRTEAWGTCMNLMPVILSEWSVW